MKRRFYYLSVLIVFAIFLSIMFKFDAHALTFFNNEDAFLNSASITHTATFNEPQIDEGILPYIFIGTIFNDDIEDSRSWMLNTLENLGWDDSSSYDFRALLSNSVQDDYFSFGSNYYVNAFGFFLYHPFDERTVGGLINIDVTELDGHVSTYVHDKDGQWLFFGFISDVGIKEIKVYNSTEDNILDTNYAYDNISRTEILQITYPTIDAVLKFFNDEVSQGSITGVGKNPWLAKLRLYLMKEMLIISKELIEQDKIKYACFILKRALVRCDEDTPPPDFVEGESVGELNDKILELMAELGCE